MSIATAIVQIIASLLAYFTARGIDNIIGKWAAYFVIAWEHVASQRALDNFRKTRDDLAASMPGKWQQWEDWRQSLTKD